MTANDQTTPLTPDAHRALEYRLASIPIFESLNMRVESMEKGRAALVMPYSPRLNGVFESFHGGLLLTLADSAACVAVLTLAGPDAAITTTDMNIRFLAACLTEVTADARVIKFGSTLCPVAVSLRDAHGTEIAVAQVTYIRLHKAPKRQNSSVLGPQSDDFSANSFDV
jgi:uncharacterized protein (TIGR00369 family)